MKQAQVARDARRQDVRPCQVGYRAEIAGQSHGGQVTILPTTADIFGWTCEF